MISLTAMATLKGRPNAGMAAWLGSAAMPSGVGWRWGTPAGDIPFPRELPGIETPHYREMEKAGFEYGASAALGTVGGVRTRYRTGTDHLGLSKGSGRSRDSDDTRSAGAARRECGVAFRHPLSAAPDAGRYIDWRLCSSLAPAIGSPVMDTPIGRIVCAGIRATIGQRPKLRRRHPQSAIRDFPMPIRARLIANRPFAS
jgi:hypothetical protein